MVDNKSKGVNILSMDGGGVRGIVEVLILMEIDRYVKKAGGPEDWITKYFDIICGTSAGGILALGVGLKKMEIEKCYELLMTISNDVFGAKEAVSESKNFFHIITSFWEKASQKINFARGKDHKGYYNSDDLNKKFEEFLSTEKMTDFKETPKVFVVATDVSDSSTVPYLIRNYEWDASIPGEASYAASTQWINGSSNWIISEAARATSAAPYYFSNFIKLDNYYVDGGLVANNPTELAIYEAKKIFPDKKIGLVVSLGTGKLPVNFNHQAKSLFGWANTLIELSTESERIHQNVQRWRQVMRTGEEAPFTFIRLNPPNIGKYPLDDYKNLKQIEGEVNGYLESQEGKIAVGEILRYFKLIV